MEIWVISDLIPSLIYINFQLATTNLVARSSAGNIAG